MTEISKEIKSEQDELVLKYINSGDFGKRDIAKKYPHIDFEKLAAEKQAYHTELDMKANEDKKQYSSNSARQIDSNNIWIKILEAAAWVSFVVSIIFALVFSIMSAEASGLIAFGIFVGLSLAALVLLAVIMVFINIAKDISCTSKDTAEIKEILKNK